MKPKLKNMNNNQKIELSKCCGAKSNHITACFVNGCCTKCGKPFIPQPIEEDKQNIEEENFERDYSHTHCWEQEQPSACGIPLEKHNQCCLCDLKYTPIEEEKKVLVCFCPSCENSFESITAEIDTQSFCPHCDNGAVCSFWEYSTLKKEKKEDWRTELSLLIQKLHSKKDDWNSAIRMYDFMEDFVLSQEKKLKEEIVKMATLTECEIPDEGKSSRHRFYHIDKTDFEKFINILTP